MKWQNEGWHHFSSFCDFQSINFDVKGNSNEFDHNHSLLVEPQLKRERPKLQKLEFLRQKTLNFWRKGTEIFEKMRCFKERSAILGILRENVAKF